MANVDHGPGPFSRFIPGTCDRQAWGILQEAARIDPMKIGKFVKDSAYDPYLAAQAAQRSVGCFTNLATLGIAGALANRRTIRAGHVADMVRYGETHGQVGRIKDMGCVTKAVAIGAIGIFSFLGVRYVMHNMSETTPDVQTVVDTAAQIFTPFQEENIPTQRTQWVDITMIKTSDDATAALPYLDPNGTYRLCIGTCLMEEEISGAQMAKHIADYFQPGQVHSAFYLQREVDIPIATAELPQEHPDPSFVYTTVDEFLRSLQTGIPSGQITITAEGYAHYSSTPSTQELYVSEVKGLIEAGYGPVHVTVSPSF